MIQPKSLEVALHNWEPWIKSIDDARAQKQSLGNDVDKWWLHAKKALRAMRLPGKPIMCIYFISCVHSEYKRGKAYIFNDIIVPDLLRDRFFDVLKSWGEHDEVIANLANARIKPFPARVYNRSDIQRLLDIEEGYSRSLRVTLVLVPPDKRESYTSPPPESPNECIRREYSPRFILLALDHPIYKIGGKVKRRMDADLALACAKMKDDGYTYKQIGEKYGWPLQEDSYGKLTRCSRAQRYVRRGRELRE